MKLKELSDYVFCRVSLYQFHDDSIRIKDLFNGKMAEVPEEYLEREVNAIHSQTGDVLGICLKTGGAHEKAEEADT